MSDGKLDPIGETTLRERGACGPLSDFEAKLFNLITSHGPKPKKDENHRFSSRLRLTERALRAIKDELALIDAEEELRNA